MRFLVAHPAPSFSVADVYEGWIEGLRSVGQHVFGFNLGDRITFYHKVQIETDDGEVRKLSAEAATELALNGLAASLFKLRPHVLLVVSGFFVDGQLLDQARRQGTRVVILMTEQPYETGRELDLAAHADLVLLNDPTNIALFQERAPTVYAPHAYREHIHRPGPTDEKPTDLVFVGTSYPSRIAFFEAMRLDGIDVALGGNWMRLAEDSALRECVVHPIDECITNLDAVNLYRASKVGLNFYRREADAEEVVGWAVGPREVEMAAVGLPFLRDPRPEGDELFPMLPTFTTPDEASDLLRWWLKHPSDREEAALKAREAIKDRTFRNHAAQLVRLLNEGAESGS